MFITQTTRVISPIAARGPGPAPDVARSTRQGQFSTQIREHRRFLSDHAKCAGPAGLPYDATTGVLSPRAVATHIERARADNVPQIVSFYDGLNETDFKARFHGPKADGFADAMTKSVGASDHMLCFDGEGKLIGVAEVGSLSAKLCDLGIVVDAGSRGQGVGRKLVLAAQDAARRAGKEVMVATTKGGSENPAIVDLMLSCGFQPVNCEDPTNATDNVRWEATLTHAADVRAQEL